MTASGSVWPPALVELYSVERTKLVRTAYLVCGTVAGAEDVVHDAVARVAARWDQVDNGRGYLYTAVVNAARDAVRREKRTVRFGAGRRETAVADDSVGLSPRSARLHDALARVPEGHRTAIVLRFFAGWDDDEIAERLGIRPATVRSWVHRGVTRLRKELKP